MLPFLRAALVVVYLHSTRTVTMTPFTHTAIWPVPTRAFEKGTDTMVSQSQEQAQAKQVETRLYNRIQRLIMQPT